MRKLALAFATVLPLLGSCKTSQKTSQLQESMSARGTQPDEVYSLWASHIQKETAGKKIQRHCMPAHYPARTAGQSKGMVIYFHGFSPCPQQFFPLAEKLADAGFDVFVPLLPGHGREPLDGPTGSKDDFRDLPANDNTKPYQDLVDLMIAMAKAGHGTKIVTGLSGGGALATGAAVHGRDIWDRVLIVAPFYKVPGAGGVISATMDFFYPQFRHGWGESCKENRRRPDGRTGLCEFTIDNLRTMLKYGIDIRGRTGEIRSRTQFVGAEKDSAADNGELLKSFAQAPDAQICFFQGGVPHAMINAIEQPGKDPFWIPSLHRDIVNFVVNGTWFPTEGVSMEGNKPACKIVR